MMSKKRKNSLKQFLKTKHPGWGSHGDARTHEVPKVESLVPPENTANESSPDGYLLGTVPGFEDAIYAARENTHFDPFDNSGHLGPICEQSWYGDLLGKLKDNSLSGMMELPLGSLTKKQTKSDVIVYVIGRFKDADKPERDFLLTVYDPSQNKHYDGFIDFGSIIKERPKKSMCPENVSDAIKSHAAAVMQTKYNCAVPILSKEIYGNIIKYCENNKIPYTCFFLHQDPQRK
ncbi:MAG: hypothetical protein ABIG84_03080 [archaeon]